MSDSGGTSQETWTEPLTDAILRTASLLSAGVYEADTHLPLRVVASLRRLSERVYEWTETHDLQRELDAEGVRTGSVYDFHDMTVGRPVYAEAVEQVLASVEAVVDACAEYPDAVPATARPLVDALAERIELRRDRAEEAELAWASGERPRIVRQDEVEEGPPTWSPHGRGPAPSR